MARCVSPCWRWNWRSPCVILRLSMCRCLAIATPRNCSPAWLTPATTAMWRSAFALTTWLTRSPKEACPSLKRASSGGARQIRHARGYGERCSALEIAARLAVISFQCRRDWHFQRAGLSRVFLSALAGYWRHADENLVFGDTDCRIPLLNS